MTWDFAEERLARPAGHYIRLADGRHVPDTARRKRALPHLGVRVGLGLEPLAQVDLLGGERVLGEADVYGLGPPRQAVVDRCGLGFGERPVVRGDRGDLPAFFPTLRVSSFAMSGTGTALSLSAMAKVSMSSSMALGHPPWLHLAAAVTWPSRVFSRM